MAKIITVDQPTSTGGQVVTGNGSKVTVNDEAIAVIGSKATCPCKDCKGASFPIIEAGAPRSVFIAGEKVALVGDKVDSKCGNCTLDSSPHDFEVGDVDIPFHIGFNFAFGDGVRINIQMPMPTQSHYKRKIQLLYKDNRTPCAQQPFEVLFDDGTKMHATTDDQGNTPWIESGDEAKAFQLLLTNQQQNSQYEIGGSHTVAALNADPQQLYVPRIWVITRKSGETLFTLQGLKDKSEGFQFITARDLYSKKIQWFEPLADHYRKLLYINLEDEVKEAYKVFTWEDIYKFSLIDRSPLSFFGGNAGDWKSVKEGADGYLLCLINNKPYWADAIGQIPYAIDTYRMFKSTGAVQYLGYIFADGTPEGSAKQMYKDLFSSMDKDNDWDNFFVLRGALFAAKKFHYTYSPSGKDYPAVDVNESITNFRCDHLGDPITKSQKQIYLS